MYKLIEGFLYSQKRNLIHYLLLPFTLPILLVIHLKRLCYKLFCNAITIPNAFVISIGNITIGGTGKTPITKLLAKHFLAKGYNVYIVTKMYKTIKQSPNPIVVKNKEDVTANIDYLSDETLLYAFNCPGALIYTHSQKWKCAKAIAKSKNNSGKRKSIVLIDDGFSHIKVHRNLDILLLDGKRGFGSGLLLPAGPLREPKSSIKRAGLIISKGSSEYTDIHFDYRLSAIIGPKHEYTPDQIPSDSFLLVSGIGNPQSFENLAQEYNITFNQHIAFDDHHKYNYESLHRIISGLKANGCTYILATEKDYMKLRAFGELKNILFFTKIEPVFPNNGIEKILHKIQQSMDSDA